MHAQAPRVVTIPPAATQQSGGARRFFAIVWRRKLVVAFVIALVAGVVGLGLATAPRSYSAAVRVAATPPSTATQSPASYSDMLGTLSDIASSRPILEQVSSQLRNRSVSQLTSEVSSAVVTGTLLIQISVSDPDPVMAAKIANTIAADLPSHDPTHGAFMIATIQPAIVPASFSSPNTKVTLLAGLLLALALGVAAAFLYDKVARTVESAADANEAAGLGTLGLIPRPRDVHGVPALDSTSDEFAALRALRVALEFASSEQPTRSLVISPVVQDPWSGWLEVNLAVALADVGHRVLLIDANRSVDASHRHPALEGSSTPGLYGLLAGEVELDEAMLRGPVEGVVVIPLGDPDLAAPTLLEMRFGHLLETIDASFDVILVHAAPVSESDDARIMAIYGSLLLTIPSGRVKPAALLRAVTGLEAVRTKTLGGVLLGGRAAHRAGG